MEPRIQYAKTADGVSIAFWTLGEGRPLVHVSPFPFGHIQMEWQWPGWRSWYQRLADKRMLVRYDNRWAGLSERKLSGSLLDAVVLDLDAVVDHLALERFALLGPLEMGPTAIAYAARHPERVSHLVLWCLQGPSEFVRLPQLQASLRLVDADWELFTETMAHAMLGWAAGDEARRLAALTRESATAEAIQALAAAAAGFDLTPLLPEVKSPTLVLHRRQVDWPKVDVARGLASRIPNARLVLLEGASRFPYQEDMEAVFDAIDEFLAEGEEAAATAAPPEVGAFRTVLFTDIEGSTAMTQRLGDAKAREVLREHERITRDCLRTHGGSEVKTMGDGFMASFGSATKALECAVAMQRAFEARNASLPAHPEPAEGRVEGRAGGGASGTASEPLHVRIGLNAGEPIAEDDPDGRGDLFGTAVIRAARIAAMAQGGEILVANVVRELAEGKGFLFGDRGEIALRGFDDPVRVYEVRWTP